MAANPGSEMADRRLFLFRHHCIAVVVYIKQMNLDRFYRYRSSIDNRLDNVTISDSDNDYRYDSNNSDDRKRKAHNT